MIQERGDRVQDHFLLREGKEIMINISILRLSKISLIRLLTIKSGNSLNRSLTGRRNSSLSIIEVIRKERFIDLLIVIDRDRELLNLILTRKDMGIRTKVARRGSRDIIMEARLGYLLEGIEMLREEVRSIL